MTLPTCLFLPSIWLNLYGFFCPTDTVAFAKGKSERTHVNWCKISFVTLSATKFDSRQRCKKKKENGPNREYQQILCSIKSTEEERKKSSTQEMMENRNKNQQIQQQTLGISHAHKHTPRTQHSATSMKAPVSSFVCQLNRPFNPASNHWRRNESVKKQITIVVRSVQFDFIVCQMGQS